MGNAHVSLWGLKQAFVEVSDQRLRARGLGGSFSVSFFLAEEVRGAANVFVSELAPEAVAALAVIAVKLNEGLRVSSIFAGDASRCPIANDGVVLGFELFP